MGMAATSSWRSRGRLRRPSPECAARGAARVGLLLFQPAARSPRARPETTAAWRRERGCLSYPRLARSPQAYCSFSAHRTAAGGRARRPMQAIAQAILEAGGAVLFQGLRAALYERLVGQPLPLGDQTAPAFGSGWPSQGGPLGGLGTSCPTPEVVPPCPTVCLGVAVDVSGGGVTPPARDAPRPPGGDGLLQLPRRLLPGGRGSPLVGLRPRARASRAACSFIGARAGAAASRARLRAGAAGR